ncbi:hypothetical protein [Duganella fentianensis]|uniref:hypothetical protein n=1 Tax=Duganella fentianensis TaxID=2692177 RepID=UPI0032B1F87E
MKLLYMNQGDAGNWAAVPYRDYQLLLLAESGQLQHGFASLWTSRKGIWPVLSIQHTESAVTIEAPCDLDYVAQHVRPLVTFRINPADPVRVVFMHLKASDAAAATRALQSAVDAIAQQAYNCTEKILWIGDFNRARIDCLQEKFSDLEVLVMAGGQSQRDLDCAYLSGNWQGYSLTASVVPVPGDQAHAGIAIEYQPIRAGAQPLSH